MSFLNATLLFGLAATAVPILLHLLARREPRKVTFPSVRFLTKRFESNRSRLRIRRWWLLALRVAAVAALAVALARPAIHQSMSVTWLTIGLITALGLALLVMASVAVSRGQPSTTTRSLGLCAAAALIAAIGWSAYTWASGPAPTTESSEPVSIAIVLDNSPTSAWRTAADNRLARMKDLATWMVTRLPRTSRIAIVDRSAQVASFSLDVSSAVARIEQLRPLEVVQPIASRIDAAARLLRTSELPNRQILLITDLTKSTWEDAASDGALAMVLGETPKISLTVLDLGEFNGTNRSLSNPRFADHTPPRGAPVAVSTTVQVNGDAGNPPLSVTAELQIYDNDPSLPVVRDGVVKRPNLKSVDRTSVKVAAGGGTDLLLTIPSLEVGTHHGQIRLIGDDAMPIDDARYFSLEVLPPSNVLLVSDDEDEAGVILHTISSAAGLIDSADAEFRVEQIQYADLAVVRLEDFHAVLLLDPPRDVLSDDALDQYALGGGGVLVCLGPNAGDQPTASQPTELSWMPVLKRRWRVPAPGTFFQVAATTHPVTEPVAKDTPWADFRVYQYWQVATEDKDVVLIQLAGQPHAAVVSRIVQGPQSNQTGRVIIVTTPIPALAAGTRGWNDLFGIDPWPAWLLTRQIAEYITRRGGRELMTVVGRPHMIDVDANPQQSNPQQSDPQQSDRSQRIQLFPPGDTTPVPLNVPAGSKRVTVNDVPRRGTYWVRGIGPGAGFSANIAEDVVLLQRIDTQSLDQIFGPDNYTLATDREGIEFAENRATQRISLHSPAILLALLLFLLEQILANRFYRGGSSQASAARKSPSEAVAT